MHATTERVRNLTREIIAASAYDRNGRDFPKTGPCTVPWGRSYSGFVENESSPSAASRWLGPSELAHRLGISIKALRVYENAGLVRPDRREGGWRIYSPDDVARLHQVLALKSVGLSLAQVRQVLDAPASDLKQTLGIQQRHLAAQISDLKKRLAAVNLAQRRLDEEGSLGVEQIIALTTETAIAPPVSAEQVEAIIHGLARSPEAD